ncbi:MAG: hypothetical protein WDN69_18545 [Aliidongia sp.]
MTSHFPDLADHLPRSAGLCLNFLAVGQARSKYGINAPAVTATRVSSGVFRVQQNMVEQLIVFLPSTVDLQHDRVAVLGRGDRCRLGRRPRPLLRGLYSAARSAGTPIDRHVPPNLAPRPIKRPAQVDRGRLVARQQPGRHVRARNSDGSRFIA